MNKRRHIDYENTVATMNKELAANKNDVDRFSELPDCLVGGILSYLPTVQAVRTMLISKRFRNSWTWINALDFKEEMREDCYVFAGKKFRTMVSQVLTLHQNSKVHTFCLKCYVEAIDWKLRSEMYSSCEDKCPKSNHVLGREVLHREPWIFWLLRNSSHLEELTIEDSKFHSGGGSEFDGQVIESYDTELDSECLKHLRKVTFWGCKKTFQMVVHMAQLILKNARVLELFTVAGPANYSGSCPLNRKDKRAIRRKIEGILAVSPHVKIDLQ